MFVNHASIMKAILGLEDWGLTADALFGLDNLAKIHLILPYPNYKTVINYLPAERKRRIAAQMRMSFRALKASLRNVPFEKTGTHLRPTGMKVVLPLNRLPALLAKEAVETISIEFVEGLNRRELVLESLFWSIKARFAVQIENETGGLQMYEDRILLVKAVDEEEAQHKLLPSFDNYAEPYLNSAGLLVRWQFEEFLDAYATGVSSLEAFLCNEGVEVHSKLGNRKLKAGFGWQRPA